VDKSLTRSKSRQNTLHVINETSPIAVWKTNQLELLDLGNLMVKSHVPFPHLSTIFEALRCHSLAERINQDKTLAPFKISGRATVRYIKQPIGHQKVCSNNLFGSIFFAKLLLWVHWSVQFSAFFKFKQYNYSNKRQSISENIYPTRLHSY
jgi:hypothetical protein